tara:strand:- start:4903 stop:6282 length:1380 start_codon:yes stop_codon:yes gene_type:complete
MKRQVILKESQYNHIITRLIESSKRGKAGIAEKHFLTNLQHRLANINSEGLPPNIIVGGRDTEDNEFNWDNTLEWYKENPTWQKSHNKQLDRLMELLPNKSNIRRLVKGNSKYPLNILARELLTDRKGSSTNIAKWNPADVWIEYDDFDFEDLSLVDNIESLNEYLDEALIEGKWVLGLSLKKGEGFYEFVNTSNRARKPRRGSAEYDVAKSYLDKKYEEKYGKELVEEVLEDGYVITRVDVGGPTKKTIQIWYLILIVRTEPSGDASYSIVPSRVDIRSFTTSPSGKIYVEAGGGKGHMSGKARIDVIIQEALSNQNIDTLRDGMQYLYDVASEMGTMDPEDGEIEKLLNDYNQKLVELSNIGSTIKKPFLKSVFDTEMKKLSPIRGGNMYGNQRVPSTQRKGPWGRMSSRLQSMLFLDDLFEVTKEEVRKHQNSLLKKVVQYARGQSDFSAPHMVIK